MLYFLKSFFFSFQNQQEEPMNHDGLTQNGLGHFLFVKKKEKIYWAGRKFGLEYLPRGCDIVIFFFLDRIFLQL